ncbi:MAG: tape measure protein [Bacteroidales bacterium]|nr:tape measure protein [Bacteroidales bacterium]
MATVDIGSLMNDRIKPEMKAAYDAVEGLTGAIKSLGDTSGKETEGMMNSFSSLNKAINFTKISVEGMSEFVKKMYEIRGSIEKAESSLQVFLGSTEKARDFMKGLINYSKESVFEIPDLSAASIQLLSVGANAEQVMSVLDQLSNISAATQQPLEGLVDLYSQALISGEVDSSGLQAWASNGVLIADVLRQMGTEVNTSSVQFEQLEQVLENLTSGGGKFAGVMSEQMSGISGSLTQLQNGLTSMYNGLGAEMEGALKGGLDFANLLVENYEEIGKTIVELVGIYSTYRAALTVINALQGAHQLLQLESARAGKALTVSQGVQAVAVKGLQGAWKHLNATMLANPYVLIAGATAAVGYAVYKAVTHTTAYTAAQERLNDAQKGVTEATVSEMRKLHEYDRQLAETQKGTEEYETLKNKIVSEYGQYIEGLDEEIERTGSLASSYDTLSEAITRSIGQRKLESLYAQEQKHLDKVVTESLNTAYEKITKKFTGDEGLNLYRQFYDYAIRGIQMSTETRKKLEGITFAEWGFDHSAVGLAFRSVSQIATDIANEKQQSNNLLKKYKEIYQITSSNTQKIEENTEKEKKKKNNNKQQTSSTVAPANESNDLEKKFQERAQLEEAFENKIQDLQLKTIQEGEEKLLNQREVNNKREIEELEKQKNDYIDAYIRKSEEIHNAQEEQKAKEDANYTKQAFDSSSVIVDTSSMDQVIAAIRQKQADENLKQEQEAWNEYLIQYGEYQEKRKAIIEKYNQLIQQATTQGEAATLEKEKQNQLTQLDDAVKASTTLMADMFAEASQKSVSEIQKIVEKTELLLNYLKATKNNEGFAVIDDKLISQGDILDLGISQEDLNNLVESEEGIIKIEKALKSLKGNLGKKSPFETFTDQIGEAAGKIGKGGKENIAEGIKDIGSAIDAFAPSLKQFGTDLGSLFGDEKLGKDIGLAIDGIQGIGQGATGVAKVMSGDVVGGVMDVVSGVGKAINAFGNLFGPNGTAHYEKVKAELGTINKVHERTIKNNKDKINFGGGTESVEAAKEAITAQEKKVENLHKITKASGQAGKSWNSRSAQYKTNRRISNSQYSEMGDIVGKDIKSVQDLYNLSGEELYKISSQMPEVWGKIDGRIRENLDSIIDCKDEAQELQNVLNQALTGVDQDAFYNDFINNLADMDTSFEDMCENFENYLRKSIIAALVASKYKDRIDKLYKNWADAAESGNEITPEEAAALRAEQEAIARDMINDRTQLAETFGWESSEDSSSAQQSAKAGAFTTITQEQGGKLEGLFTSVQNHVSSMDDKMTNMSSAMYDSVDVLVKIEENTSFCRELETIRQDIKGIIRDGLKVK